MYLYLTKKEWIEPWLNGGEIPINLASTYRKMERNGIFTPDENLIYEATHPYSVLQGVIALEDVRGITLTNVNINGYQINHMYIKERREEDGLILSFCNHFSERTAHRLEKEAAIEIIDIDKLIKSINRQTKTKCKRGNCEYTLGHNRNHFLKSYRDAWQDEHRLFWNHPESINAQIPRGIGTIKWLNQ
ncbi:hypothetical protein [Halomonas sp. KO116]|uniref:hypothetical protein n=1 Tax=Halomonas sp. KO116 TaxID=1504981 RepID=UPI0004E3AB01|nr:hypothetical protein [Halomonas sp. KO116]AJY52512.1 hypothetical protein KO116_04049 [Halomonas sp. KO116]